MKILFYPDNIKHHSKIRYLLDHLKIKTTNNSKEKWNIAIFWDYNTTRTLPIELQVEGPVINKDCLTADKFYVDDVFWRVFKRSTRAGILTGYGYCVKKSIKQAVHDGEIVQKPVDLEEGFIYQKLLDSRCQTDLLCDIRVPYIGGEIPCLWLKFRPITNTFGADHGKLSKVILVENVNSILSEVEQQQIISFCKKYPVDYCELDVIRNNSDGEIYVIDMNNTPGDSLMFHMSKKQYNRSIKILSESLSKYLQSLTS